MCHCGKSPLFLFVDFQVIINNLKIIINNLTYSAKFLNSRNNAHIFSKRLVHTYLRLLSVLSFILIFFLNNVLFYSPHSADLQGCYGGIVAVWGGFYQYCVNLEGWEITQLFWPVPSKHFLFTLTFSFISENKIDFSLVRGLSFGQLCCECQSGKCPCSAPPWRDCHHHLVSPCLGRCLHRKLHRAVSNG